MIPLLSSNLLHQLINLYQKVIFLNKNPSELPIIIIKPYYSFQIINKRMIVGQLPSLEQIYDYSSEDLKSIVTRLTLTLNSTSNNTNQTIDLQEYIENINIELEERKTLQFFQELCSHDNPYLKKVTDFNNQFLKLAEEAIAEQEKGQKQKIEDKINKDDFDQKNYIPDSHDGTSVTSATSSNTHAFSHTQPSETKEQVRTSNQKRWLQGQKKMGLGGNHRKTKNSMKDFIMSTLTKNKADCTYVVKSNGPPKPQPAYTVNQRGHLVNPSTLQPISTKNIKSNSSVKPQQTPLSSTKQISEAPKKVVNEKELQKKRKQVVQKMKGKQPEKKKQKHLNNKDLVEMIRQQQMQQEVRKKREMEKELLDRIEIPQKRVESQKENEKSSLGENKDLFVDEQKVNVPCLGCPEVKVEEIKEEIQSHGEEKESSKVEEEKQIESEIIQEKIAKFEEIRQNNNVHQKEKTKEKMVISHISQQNFTENSSYHKKEKKQETKAENVDPTTKEIFQNKIEEKDAEEKNVEEKDNIYQCQIDQLRKIKEEADNFDRNMEEMNFKKKKQQQFGDVVDLASQKEQIIQVEINKVIQLDPLKEEQKKRCYNQEYWIHIREEAEFKIKRFKEEKEIEQNHKKKLRDQIKNNISDEIQKIQNEPSETDQTIQGKTEKDADIEEVDEFYEKKKKQLKKMVNDHKKRIPPKRATPTIIAPPKPMYALPTFNYLQVYPTFNHIFSVMYTKAEHQALQDIPSIMKQLTNIFTTHLNHFKTKNPFFQAAIFLPFDSSNKVQLTDPKQLLLHTESTYVNLKKMVERLQTFNSNLHGEFNNGDNRYYRVVKTKEEVYDIITTGFLRRKYWKELPHGCSLRSSWNLFWSWSKPDIDISKLLVWQRINHFPFNKNLSRKDLLYKNLDSFRKMLRIPFSFLPLTFNLPKQYTQFSMKFHEDQMLNKDTNYWIMKPIGKSRGRGIKVISNLAELNYTDNIVVQKYITNPLLLEGYKFDMRIYVLVTSFHPLEAFVYRQGFARLSTEKFSLEPMMMKNAFVHLTNFAINRNNEEAKQTANFSGGSKISLKTLKDKLTKMNFSFSKIWSQVHEIIIKSLLGCSISVPSFPAAFELFGYDIMIDTDGDCHLIQINASPSLERSYLIDEIVKQSLIDDILDIVDPPDFDKEQLLDIMSERLSGKGKITPEEDLIAIARCLKYKPVRKFGQIPQNMGLFQRVAPSQQSIDLEKLIKSRSGANNPRNID